MEPNQYILDFPVLHSHSTEDFVIGDCNRIAADFIAAWPDWPTHALILVGPRASGKTHLAKIWQDRAGASLIAGRDLTKEMVPDLGKNVIVEGAGEGDDPEALLHLYNWLGANQGFLLMTETRAPSAWGINLKDLASRLKATPVAKLAEPDEEILAAVMAKQFSDHQIVVDDTVMAYLHKRMERSYAAAAEIVYKLDQLSLTKKSRVTIPLARRVLEDE